MTKSQSPFSFVFVVSKIVEKFAIKRYIDCHEKCGFFVISSVVLGLLLQLKIFCSGISQNFQGSHRSGEITAKTYC